MADKEIETTEITEVQNTEVQETQDVKPQTDAEFMEETISGIKETQKAVQGTEDTGTGGETQETVNADLAGRDIPDVFSEAAEKSGMTSVEIIELANSHTDEELLELIPYLKESTEEPEVKEDVKQEIKETVVKTEDKTTEIEQQLAEKIEKQILEKYGTTLEAVNQFKAYQAEQEGLRELSVVNSKLDEAAKEFSIFGKTSELPCFPGGKLKGQLIPTAPAVKARLEVVGYASAFKDIGQPIDEAMDNALATYRGKYLTKEIQRSVYKDLKNHETQLSGPRTAKATKKTFSDSREELIDDIRQLQRAAGVDT